MHQRAHAHGRTDTYTRLAHPELLDKLLSDDQRSERRGIYHEIAPGYSDSSDQALQGV